MEEWQKILLSTIIGFVAGLAVEPLKSWIRNKIEIRESQKLLIQEINMVARQCKPLWAVYDAAIKKVISAPGPFKFRLQGYPYLMENRMGTLLKIKGYEEIRRLFEWIARADGTKDLPTECAGNIIFQFAVMHDGIKNGKMPRQFNKLLSCDDFMYIVGRVIDYQK